MTDLTPLQTIGIFAGIPIGLFVLISLLVVLPSWARDARYRPGLPWHAEPTWFEGPDDALEAGAASGAGAALEPGAAPASGAAAASGTAEDRERGGASAGW